MHTRVTISRRVVELLLVSALLGGSQCALEAAAPPTQPPTAPAPFASGVWRVDEGRCYYTTGKKSANYQALNIFCQMNRVNMPLSLGGN
jgi:hypothetical protein